MTKKLTFALWIFRLRKETISTCSDITDLDPQKRIISIQSLVCCECLLLLWTGIVFVVLQFSVSKAIFWLVCAQSRLISMNLPSHCSAIFSRRRIRICLLSHAFFMEEKKVINEGRWKPMKLLKILINTQKICYKTQSFLSAYNLVNQKQVGPNMSIFSFLTC